MAEFYFIIARARAQCARCLQSHTTKNTHLARRAQRKRSSARSFCRRARLGHSSKKAPLVYDARRGGYVNDDTFSEYIHLCVLGVAHAASYKRGCASTCQWTNHINRARLLNWPVRFSGAFFLDFGRSESMYDYNLWEACIWAYV